MTELREYAPTATETRLFEEAYRDAAEREGEPTAVTWAPQPGSQTDFLGCPLFEVLLHGGRGGGKSDALLMDYAQHVGRGHEDAWRGVLFRKSYPQLGDIVAKSHRWFPKIFPAARFNWARMCWIWPSGENLSFRHMARPEDYYLYHGFELPWIGWEELTTWADDRCYTSMMSCCRTARPNVPRKIRSTTNPYGAGTSWIRERFNLSGQWWLVVIQESPVDERGYPQRPRCAIPSKMDENRILLEADPDYKITIAASATSEAMAKAWLSGDWDIVAGGMFDDVWTPANVFPPFDIPKDWKIDRAFDWGSSKPFSVGWYAQSNGSDLRLPNGKWVATVRNDLFRFREWYGWTGKPNQGKRMLAVDIAQGIVEREIMWGLRTTKGTVVQSGPADTSIFTVENGMSVAMDMLQPVRVNGAVYEGVEWLEADKRPGSRKMGWEKCRTSISAVKPKKPGLPRDAPGFFVVEGHNPQFLRTVLSLPRDEKDMDDADSDAEDHIADEFRYRVRALTSGISEGRTAGVY